MARLTLGDITISTIIEQEAPLFDIHTFLPGLSAETLAENRAWMQACGALDANDQLILCIQSYIVRTPHHTILVDTCVGNDKPRPHRPFWDMMKGEAYMRGLAREGLTVEDIDVVMCTHLHVDHVGWNTRLENGRWVPTFPNARYLFSGRELDHWTARNEKEPIACIVDSVLPIVAAGRADLVTSDHAFDDHVRLEPTPGHSFDHYAVQLGRGRPQAVISGDLIHTPLQAKYPELSMFSDWDQKQSATTRRRFLECYCDTGTLVCTAHFPSPSQGTFTREGEGFAFVRS